MSRAIERLAMLGAALPLAAHAQWTAQYDAGLAHERNFSRAQQGADRISDTAITLRAALDRALPAGESAEITVGAEARLARYTRSHGASYAAVGLNGGWRTKLGLGRTAPWIAADASLGFEDAGEAVRDALRSAVSLSAGRRFDERLTTAAGFAYDRREQREDLPVVPGYGGKPFSLQGRTLFARASYAIGERASLTGSAALRTGDVESSTRRNFAIFTAANAIANDPALGADFIAYRLPGARTRTIGGGVTWDFGRRVALDATLIREDTRVAGGLDYDNVIFGVTLAYRP